MHYLDSFISLIKNGVQKAVFLMPLVDIKCIYYVTKTVWGCSLYLCALSVVLGTKTEKPGLLFMICLFF